MVRKQKPPKDPVHNIVKELIPLMVPIKSVRPDPKNARQHNKRNLDTIRDSLIGFGQRKAIVVNHDGTIEAGSGMHEVATQLGWSHIAAVHVEDDGPTATAFGIMDNQSALLASWDLPQLKDLLADLDTGDFEMDLTGFATDEIEDLMTQYHVPDPNEEWGGMPGYEHLNKKAYRQILVSFKDEEDIAAFAKLVEQNITDKTKDLWYPKVAIERCMDKNYGEDSA